MKPIKEKRGGAMLATERRQRIMQEMHEHKVVVIVELAEKLGVTPMTIQR